MRDSDGCRTRLQKKLRISSLGVRCYSQEYLETLHHHNYSKPCSDDKLDIIPGTRSAIDIWSIPTEILVSILCGFHIKDLLRILQTTTRFNELVKHNTLVWKHVNFNDLWPTKSNLKHFENASSHGNFEATVKLGIAYLYNEGLPYDNDGSNMQSNGCNAADLLSAAEQCCKETQPFTWLFFRPPWSPKNCCKEIVFTSMRKMFYDGRACENVLQCVAQIALLSNDKDLALKCLNEAKDDHNSASAAYALWSLHRMEVIPLEENHSEIEMIRNLRSIVAMGKHTDANLALLFSYAEGRTGGLDDCIAAQFTREFIQSSTASNLKRTFSTHTPITPSMRYILVDWLVEVATVKNFDGHTLHQSIYLMDNYMHRRRTIPRCKLQLLGVACLVICSRFSSQDVITIWEACWLTDNTYKYEDVVKMMADIVVTLRGQIRVLTTRDYIQPINAVLHGSTEQWILAEYISELVLLQTDLSIYSHATLAASCLLLARAMTDQETLWTERAIQFTGFGMENLRHCVMHIHEKCFVEEAPTDHRHMKLSSVKTRYNTERFCHASQVPHVSREALLAQIGGCQYEWYPNSTQLRLRSQPYMIMSPSRKSKHSKSSWKCRQRKRDTATPTLPRRKAVNESLLSGYEGDKEDADDFENNNEDEKELADIELSDTDEDYDEEENNYSDWERRHANQMSDSKRSISIHFVSPMGAISSHSTSLRVNQSGIHLNGQGSAFKSVRQEPSRKYQTRSQSSTLSNQIKRKSASPEGRQLKPKVQ